MPITAEAHQRLHAERRLRAIREVIRSKPPHIQALVEEGKRKINDALAGDDQKWFGGIHFLEVFEPGRQIDPEVRKLLKRLYEAAGYDIRWKDPFSGDVVNAVRMEPD